MDHAPLQLAPAVTHGAPPAPAGHHRQGRPQSRLHDMATGLALAYSCHCELGVGTRMPRCSRIPARTLRLGCAIEGGTRSSPYEPKVPEGLPFLLTSLHLFEFRHSFTEHGWFLLRPVPSGWTHRSGIPKRFQVSSDLHSGTLVPANFKPECLRCPVPSLSL